MIYNYNYYPLIAPFLPPNCDKPPTIYSILDSIVNGMKEEEEYTKIKNLAKEGRTTIFDFDYELTEHISKEKFECMILNHFLERRIGFETVTSFKIHLDNKINEIMPFYNKLFNSFENWDIFEDGEKTTKTGTDNKTTQSTNNSTNNITTSNTNTTTNNVSNNSTSSNTNISDRRFSDLPQSELNNLQDASYVTEHNYDTITNNSSDNSTANGSSSSTTNTVNNESLNTTNSGNDSNTYNEVITRTQNDKIAIFKEMQENINKIYTMIFNELECLFYQLV